MIYFRNETNPDGSRSRSINFFLPFRDPAHFVQFFAAIDFLTSLV